MEDNRDECVDVRSILDIEGYGQVGMIADTKLEKCGKNRSKLVVELVDGRRMCSPCLPETVVGRSAKVLELYSKDIKLVNHGLSR